MINNELRDISVISFTTGTDSYGQKRTSIASLRTIKGVVKKYSNQLVDNPKFNDIELIVLTLDRSVSDANQLEIDDVIYDVIYVTPSFRFNELFLKRY